MSPEPQFLFAPFRLDPTNARLWCRAQALTLTPKAFAVLHQLVAHAGQLVTKEALLDAVWPDTAVSEAVLKVCIGEIRKTLGDAAKAPQFIATVYRRGYRFIAPVTVADPCEGDHSKDSPHPLAPVTSSPEPLAAPSHATPLVGRQTELARLHRWLEQARRGKRQVGFVTGEAGIGKTAVIEAFLAQVAADSHLVIAHGQCVEHYGLGEAYLPMLEALGRLCRTPGSEHLLMILRRHAPLWLAQIPWLFSTDEREVLQRELIGATQPRMLREMAEAIEVLTVETPLLLVLEDLHWSDYATIDLVAMLAQRREAARLLLLGTYRPVEVIVRGHPLKTIKQELQLHGHCEELPLELLSETAVATYLAARCPRSRLPVELVQMIHQRTNGNPLFMANIVEDLLARGVLSEQDGQWQLTARIDEVEVGAPENLRQMIAQQIERLSREEQRVLEAASAAGVEFAVAAVAAALEADSMAVEEWCEELVWQHHVLRPAGIVQWPDGTVTACYRFWHWLYQHVVYQRLGATRRIHLHQQIGTRIEAAYGLRVSEIAAELATHFERGRDDRRAVQYLQHAAENATQRHAYREVMVHLTKGLALLQAMPDTPECRRHELAIHTALGPALIATKGYAAPEVERTYARARALCQQAGDTSPHFDVLRGLWNCYVVRAELQTARELGEQLLAFAQHAHESALLVEAHRALGTTLLFLGELAPAREHLEAGIASYNPQQHHILALRFGADPGVLCQLYTASTLWLLGYTEQARHCLHEGLTLAHEGSHPFSLAFALSFAAQLYQRQRQAKQVQEWANAAIAVATNHGFPFFLAWGRVLRGWSLAEQGQGEAGLAQLRQGLGTWQATGTMLTRPHALSLLAETYRRSGQAEKGLHVLEKALTAVHTTGERWWEAELHRLTGELLLIQNTQDKIEAAEANFRRAFDTARSQGAQTLKLRAVISLCRSWQHQGRGIEARQLLAETYSAFTEGFGTADLDIACALLEELKG
jgi:DNA-binding winged helix-turn-helix (wHTH) protein/predicted ATPase